MMGTEGSRCRRVQRVCKGLLVCGQEVVTPEQPLPRHRDRCIRDMYSSYVHFMHTHKWKDVGPFLKSTCTVEWLRDAHSANSAEERVPKPPTGGRGRRRSRATACAKGRSGEYRGLAVSGCEIFSQHSSEFRGVEGGQGWWAGCYPVLVMN